MRWVAAILLAATGICWAANGPSPRDAALTAAAERAAKVADRFEQSWARYAVAQEWERTDPAKAAELADQIESWTAKADLLGVVMFDWGQRDPNAAAEWGLKFKQRTDGPPERRNVALQYAVVGLAERHPKLADKLIWPNLQEEGWGNKARTAPMLAAREIARTDPAFALAMAGNIQHDGLRVEALRGVLRGWAARDPQAARDAMSGQKDREFQQSFPRDLAEGWAHKDPKAAAEFARSIPAGAGEDRSIKVMAMCLVAHELVRTDAAAAAALCSEALALNVGKWHEQFPRVAKVAAEVGSAMARSDPQAAAAWAEALPAKDGACRRDAIDGVAAGWAIKDPAAAMAYYCPPEATTTPADSAAKLAASRAKARGAESPAKAAACRGTGAAWPDIAAKLAKTDAQAALRLVERTDRLVLKSHILRAIAATVARRDGPAAAAIVDKWAGVTDYYGYRADAAAQAARAWAAKDPQAAAAWAAHLEPIGDRLPALQSVAAAWARAAPAAAQAWAAALADPRQAACALVGVAEGLRPGNNR